MNFKHLYYFWMAARTGGVNRAGQHLHVTPQTLSTQIKLLEERLGCQLFERSGRNIRLTDAGRIAAGYADQIFSLGLQMEDALRVSRAAHAASLVAAGSPSGSNGNADDRLTPTNRSRTAAARNNGRGNADLIQRRPALLPRSASRPHLDATS